MVRQYLLQELYVELSVAQLLLGSWWSFTVSSNMSLNQDLHCQRAISLIARTYVYFVIASEPTNRRAHAEAYV